MPVVRAQCSFAMDSVLPRDRCMITPHFQVGWDPNNPLSGVDGNNLAQDLATALDTWSILTQEVNVKIYDAQGTAPVLPIGNKTVGAGLFSVSTSPRETAVCLSFYAAPNAPSRRGRLYLPQTLVSSGSGSVRPASGTMQKVADLVPIFAALGGANVDWVVYSRKLDSAAKVSNWFVDDEWDTVRSRGLRPSTRLAGTTSG